MSLEPISIDTPQASEKVMDKFINFCVFDTQLYFSRLPLPTDSAKVVLLITDGAANDKKHDSIVEAKKLRAYGFRIITIGIGIDIRKKMLRKLASAPYESNVFIVKFGALMSLLSGKKSPLRKLKCGVPKKNKYTIMRQLKREFILQPDDFKEL